MTGKWERLPEMLREKVLYLTRTSVRAIDYDLREYTVEFCVKHCHMSQQHAVEWREGRIQELNQYRDALKILEEK